MVANRRAGACRSDASWSIPEASPTNALTRGGIVWLSRAGPASLLLVAPHCGARPSWPPRACPPRPPALALRRGHRPSYTGTDVLLFTIVMDAWQRERTGCHVDLITSVCDVPVPLGRAALMSLHVQACLYNAARLSPAVMTRAGDAPLVVELGGSGGAQAYDHLLGTPGGASRRGWSTSTSAGPVSTCCRRLADAQCHRAGPVPPASRHAPTPVRTCARVVDVVELDDDGLCCGAAVRTRARAELAGSNPARKLDSIRRRRGLSGDVVASANRGARCILRSGCDGRTRSTSWPSHR